MRWPPEKLPILVWGLVFLWVAWLVYMLIKLNTISTVNPDYFGNFGVLGDSFAMVGSLFASLALIFTAITNNQLSKDRRLQYEKQLYDLLVLNKEISSAQYYLDSGSLGFFPDALLDGERNYFILRDKKYEPEFLDSSIESLIFSIDLALKYIKSNLVHEEGYIAYKINSVVKDRNVQLYLETLKRRREVLGLEGFPFPYLYERIQSVGRG
ncbi:hypothetical protein GCM10010840_09260 [Deinococcus aerolatus]|uniref:Phage abortive infection protein n=1 Tax=Deinococcus aerolatus TaxID=522487 RepID=A0ABQ2G3A0_9DEIO|nr:hypothetical protein [Deinococcus aerolatus]GGL73369.1 hypothetical protein GCM10010840_09260 [Deinococcus aerolatus]